jgi:diguanylate cyclase (GGDEF)-like protein
MSTASIALLAAAAALTATAVVAVLVIRARRESDRWLARRLLVVGERMDTLARDLAYTVDKVQEDSVRARIVESLGQTLDLDEVLSRCAEAAASLPGVAGAIVSIEVDGAPRTAVAGLRPESVGAVSGPPDGSLVRAVGISYHYPAGGAEHAATQSAIAVPIESSGTPLGFLTVFGPGEDPPVAGPEFQTLEAIAAQTAPAIVNARRLESARRLPDTDGLSDLGNRQRFHETLALEVGRAHRHGNQLAVCVLDVDDFKLANERIGQIEADARLTEVAELLRETIKPGDLACRIGGDEFGVILAQSSRIAAEALFAQVQATLRRMPSSSAPLSLSAGIAELKPDDDGVSLFERAERALHRAKQTGKGTAA